MKLTALAQGVLPFCRSDPSSARFTALLEALARKGHEVSAVAPLYDGVDTGAYSMAGRIRPLEVSMPSGDMSFRIRETVLGSRLKVVLLENSRGASEELKEAEDEASLSFWTGFLRAALSLTAADSALPDALLLDGWRTGIAGLIEDVRPKGIPLVLFVFDAPSGGGNFSSDALSAAGIGTGPLSEKIPAACDIVLVPSPEEKTARAYSAHNPDTFRVPVYFRCDKEDPGCSTHGYMKFSADDLRGKRRTKGFVQSQADLPVRMDVPLFVMPGHVNDMTPGVIRKIILDDVQVLMVQNRHEENDGLEKLACRFPDRLGIVDPGNDSIMPNLTGAADFMVFLESDPDADGLFKSLIHGAVPVLNEYGPVPDFIVEMEPGCKSGSAFTFSGGGLEDAVAALRRAEACFRKPEFRTVPGRLMRMTQNLEDVLCVYERALERESARAKDAG